MTGAERRQAGRARRVGRRLSTGSLVVRRRHSLLDLSGRAVQHLRLKVPAPVDAVELVLGPYRGEVLAGSAPQGLDLQIEGDSVRLAAGAEAERNQLVVALESPLSSALEAGAVVSVAPAVEVTLPRARVRSVSEDRLPAELIGRVSFEVVVEAALVLAFGLRVGDLVEAGRWSGELVATPRPAAGSVVLRVGGGG